MDGRWVVYGSMGGVKVEKADFSKLFFTRGNILFSTLRNRTDAYKAELISDFARDILHHFETKTLNPIIDRVMNLSQIVEAHQYIETNANTGKIVLLNDLADCQ